MAGQRQKRPDDLVFRRGGRVKPLDVVDPTVVRVDWPPPEDISPPARSIWRETMKLANSRLLPTDYFQAMRWITWVDKWLEQMSLLANEDAVEDGSTGKVRNPRFMVIRQIEQNVVHAEQAMGLDPRARMRNGITYKQEQDALDELKARRDGRKPTQMEDKA